MCVTERVLRVVQCLGRLMNEGSVTLLIDAYFGPHFSGCGTSLGHRPSRHHRLSINPRAISICRPRVIIRRIMRLPIGPHRPALTEAALEVLKQQQLLLLLLLVLLLLLGRCPERSKAT